MKNSKKYFYKILLHIIFPLIVGTVIYISGRHNTALNKYLELFAFHNYRSTSKTWWNKILIYNIPDFCWDYSLASALFLWREMNLIKIKYFGVIVLSLLLATEGVQFFLPHFFTFDWLDMIAAIAAFFLSYTLNQAE